MAEIEALLEAERRGILPADRAGLLQEARSRGLIPDSTETSTAENVDERGIPIEPGAAMTREFSEAGKKLGAALTLKGAAPFTLKGKGMLQEPTENLVEGALQAVNAPFVGAGRLAGTTLQDLLQPYLGVEPAAGVASVADAAAQLGVPFATTKLSSLIKAATRSAVPLRGEKIATLKSTLAGEEATTTKQAIEEAKRVQLNLAKQREQNIVAGRKLQEEVAPSAPAAEEAGGKFAREIFPARKAKVKAQFSKAYDDLIESGTDIEATTANTEEALNKILGETGILRGALSTKAESAASRIKRGLEGVKEGEIDVETAVRSAIGGRRNSLELEEEVYNRVKDKIQSGGPGVPQHLSVDLLRDAAIAEEIPKTAADLMQTTLRVRAAKRAAFDSGQPNIGRQFREIEKGLIKDVEQTSPDLAKGFSNITGEYRREYVPLFTPKALPERLIKRVREDVEEVVPSIIQRASSPRRVESINTAFRVITNPKDKEAITGAWLRTGIEKSSIGGWEPKSFVKYWDDHLDPKTNNYVLRKAFGEQKFQSVNKFVDELRASKAVDFNEIADEAIKNIGSRKADTIKQLRAQYEKDVKSLDPKLVSLKYGTWIGILGIGGSSAALFLAGPSAAAATAVGAGISWLSIRSAARIINTARGAQLMKRAARAAPGTVEAVSVAAQLAALAKALPKEKE